MVVTGHLVHYPLYQKPEQRSIYNWYFQSMFKVNNTFISIKISYVIGMEQINRKLIDHEILLFSLISSEIMYSDLLMLTCY